MKVLKSSEMYAVNGGVKYVTSCGYTFTDKSPWTVGKAYIHKAFCSQCCAAKKVKGYWYTFASRGWRW